MAYVSGRDQFALDLCNILGLDPKITRSIAIDIKVDSLVLVNVTQLNTDDRFNGLLKLLKPYRTVKYALEKRNTDE